MMDHNIDCSNYYRRISRQELEIDCLALWEGVLFVFECKNYALPSENPRHQYSFLLNQKDAKRQLLEKVNAINSRPALVSEALKKNVTWTKVIPIVLNGMPFSLSGKIDGAYFLDYATLKNFLQTGMATRYSPGLLEYQTFLEWTAHFALVYNHS